jgi:site-specific DNA-cytosine methylase
VTAYYNEHDPYAAEWLRRLILNGHIAPGDVDESDIRDIRPDDLKGYTQCHFFAGIGVWSYALRRAGWPDDRPIWTGSCPCQPFSAAGARAGFADERHLWPAFNHLIDQRRPATVVGEQVENAGDWLDLVSADLEAQGYAFGAAFLPAAGFGGAHIRSRNYWMAHMPNGDGRGGERGAQEGIGADAERRRGFAGSGVDVRLADSTNRGRGIVGRALEQGDVRHVGGMADANCDIDERRRGSGNLGRAASAEQKEARQRQRGGNPLGNGREDDPARTPMLGRHAVDWLFCRDGKWRPVGARIQPLANAVACGMGRLRASIVDALEKEMSAYAKAFSRDPREDLRDLWEGLPSTCLPERKARTNNSFHETEILFAFLCQLSAQGWAFAQGIPCPSEEGEAINVRVLWDRQAASRASRGRGLDQQRPDQPSDALHFLSSILARHASQAWQEAVVANARVSFPLTEISDRRTGRLKAYGNALDAETATRFLEAVMASL